MNEGEKTANTRLRQSDIYLGKSVMDDGHLENADGEKILLWKRKATTTRKTGKNYDLAWCSKYSLAPLHYVQINNCSTKLPYYSCFV
jgi:hypothetical protein